MDLMEKKTCSVCVLFFQKLYHIIMNHYSIVVVQFATQVMFVTVLCSMFTSQHRAIFSPSLFSIYARRDLQLTKHPHVLCFFEFVGVPNHTVL